MKKESLDNPKEETSEKKITNKPLYLILLAMIILVVVFFLAYFLFSSINKINYNGLTFTKEMFGEIPVFHHYYNFMSQGKLFQYNLYLRNDPRQNKVALTGDAIGTGIEFFEKDTIYISLEKDALVGCEYGSVGIANLASFLVDNKLNIKGASADKELAMENNLTYATCKDNPREVVITIRNSNETRVIHEEKDCYIIEVANCEVLPAIEKFQVQSILDARDRRNKLSQL